MLYSSSREDLKKSLGLGYFVGEYYANSLGDLTWNQFTEYISRERTDGPLTLKEQLILEEKVFIIIIIYVYIYVSFYNNIKFCLLFRL